MSLKDEKEESDMGHFQVKFKSRFILVAILIAVSRWLLMRPVFGYNMRFC